MAEPAAIVAAQAVLQRAAAIAQAVAPLFPGQIQAYIDAFAIADELMSAAIGTIRPETPAEIEEAEKVNPLGMG